LFWLLVVAALWGWGDHHYDSALRNDSQSAIAFFTLLAPVLTGAFTAFDRKAFDVSPDTSQDKVQR
jgi:hypothetical protein